MKKIYLFLLFLTPFFFIQCNTKTNKTEEIEQKAPEVKNVIIMIGDGMGVTQIYAGLTKNKGLNLERCHFVGFSKTYPINAYITDSAAGGTAIACGTKTKVGAIGVDADDNPVKSMLEYAAENGLATGIAVSCGVTHATPASFVAHQVSRTMLEEIAEDYVNSDLTVFIGGGRKHFNRRSDGQDLIKKLEEKDFTIAYDLEEAKKITAGKLAALVTDKHPEKYPERGDMLPESVQIALNILKKNDKGFCLMVEGSQIDWACHSNNFDDTVAEMIDFDHAIKVAFDYADQDPNTLVIVTADHETGGLSLVGGDMEKEEIRVEWGTKGHSAVMVPVFAYGAGAKEFAGIYQNSDILSKVLKLYGFAQ